MKELVRTIGIMDVAHCAIMITCHNSNFLTGITLASQHVSSFKYFYGQCCMSGWLMHTIAMSVRSSNDFVSIANKLDKLGTHISSPVFSPVFFEGIGEFLQG